MSKKSYRSKFRFSPRVEELESRVLKTGGLSGAIEFAEIRAEVLSAEVRFMDHFAGAEYGRSVSALSIESKLDPNGVSAYARTLGDVDFENNEYNLNTQINDDSGVYDPGAESDWSF